MGLLGRNPAPVRFGTPTQGVFSDQMFPDGQGRTLPNGWNFDLGNEDYFDLNGRNYEGVGIPPDIPTPVFTDDELKNQQDSAMAAATQPTP
jgi:C-terminal processing protease CtpA/Prc